MGFTQDFLTSRRNIDDGSIRVGELERLWYSSSDNTIRIGDGTTPGGIIVSGGGGGGSYVLPTASTTVKGGVKIDGTTITITNEVISGFDGNYNSLTNKPTIFSGSYNDLSDKPVLFSGNYNDLTNKPALFSGSYDDLTNKPVIPAAQVQVDWNSSSGITAILNKPVLFSGSYNDLTDKPVLFSGSYNDLTDKPVLFSGNYNDLTNKPTIPAAQINSDWNAIESDGVSFILNKPTIPDITGITEVFAATSEPMGHADRTHSLISFDNSSRTFTISPVNSSYDVWVKGTKWVITNSRSVTIPDNTGLYYIYFDSTGALQYKTTFFDWPNDCMTAYVYWNKLTGKAPYVADERHGITLDWQTHEYLHRTRGAAIASGFTASNYVLDGDGSLDSHLQIDISDGTFFDEDLQVDVISTNTPTPNVWEQDLTGPARIPMFYINSGGGWVMDNPTDFPVKQGLLPKYNLYSGGNWTTPDIDNNKFGVSFILATNNINYPVIGIIGQSSHANQGDAEAVNFTDLSLPGFPVVELRQLYKLVYQCKTSYTNTVHARLASIFDLRSFSSTTSAMATYTDHGSLSGLLDDDHPQYLLRTDTNALNVLSNTSSSMAWINTVFAPSTDAKTTITASQGEASIQLIQGFPAGVSTSVSFTFNSNGTLTFPDNTTQSTAFTGIQTSVSGNAGTATTLQTARNINGVSFNGSADITVTAAAGTLSGSTLASGVTASSLTSVGTLTSLTTSGTTSLGASTGTTTVNNMLKVNYTGSTDSSLQITGSNTKGGAGYHDFLKITNGAVGVTNPNKFMRVNSTGGLEVLNSAYTSTILSISDAGVVGHAQATVNNNDPTTNYINFNNGNSVIYDDGNYHIHSRTSGQSMWINTNGGQINLGVQSPISGGAIGTGIGIGTSSLTGFVTITGTKSWVTAANYGYLTGSSSPTGYYNGGNQTISNVSLYANGRGIFNEVDALSDERAKNIQGDIPLDAAITFIKSVNGILYSWKPEAVEFEDTGIKSGFSAQSVHKAGFGHMISMLPNEKLEESTDATGWTSPDKTQLSMNYNQAIPYHHEVIKHLLDRIEHLESVVAKLTGI